MTVDLKLEAFGRSLSELVALESDVAGRIEQARQLSSGRPEALAAVQQLWTMVQTHRDQLAAYLKDTDGAMPRTSPMPSTREVTALSEALRDLSLAFHRLALDYAMLYEMALRLYEPRLRIIASESLKANANAALSTAHLLPEIVAWELSQRGLLCDCVCPMCSIGACGCVAYGSETLVEAWRDAVPTKPKSLRLVLQPPKPETELARAGARGGDLVLAIDGEQLFGREEVQAALRKHTLGDKVRILIQSGSEPPRELIVRHAGDYPKS